LIDSILKTNSGFIESSECFLKVNKQNGSRLSRLIKKSLASRKSYKDINDPSSIRDAKNFFVVSAVAMLVGVIIPALPLCSERSLRVVSAKIEKVFMSPIPIRAYPKNT